MDAAPGPFALSAKTLQRVKTASGSVATASLAEMEKRWSWFRRLPADQRAGVLLVTQTSIANFVEWLRDPAVAVRLTVDAFRTAPPDLARWVSLRQTVEIVRVATIVFEERLPQLAADDAERETLTEASVRFSREVAFAAATAYAGAAEARGAWDARLEALVVDGIVRGDPEESLLSRAAALGWDPATPATVLVGDPPPDEPTGVLSDLRTGTHSRGEHRALVGVQGSRLIVVAAALDTDTAELLKLVDAFGDGPVVIGPTAPSLSHAHESAADALSGLRAVPAWPNAPRPVLATDLLPERALSGDPEAERLLVEQVLRPLVDSGGALLETLDAYFECSGVLESCARQLFVHPNTVRYRLKRIAEVTGRVPADPRDAMVLRVGLAVGRLVRSRGQW